MQFDRRKFFAAFDKAFTPLKSTARKGLSDLLDFIEEDAYITDARHAAYMLATVKRECADTWRPIHEYGPRSYFVKRYGGQTAKGRELGNDTPDEGAAYAGRGYPQTTGETNYERIEEWIRKEYPDIVAEFETTTGRAFDLTVGDQPGDEKDPDNMMYPAIAYAAMSLGMRYGLFTRRKLSDYIRGEKCDYFNSRKIINGLDHAGEIAANAAKFERILFAAVIAANATGAAPSEPAEQSADNSPTSFPPSEPSQGAELPAPTAPVEGGGAEDLVQDVPHDNPSPAATAASVGTGLVGSVLARIGLSEEHAFAALDKIQQFPARTVLLLGGVALLAFGFYQFFAARRRAHDRTVTMLNLRADPNKINAGLVPHPSFRDWLLTAPWPVLAIGGVVLLSWLAWLVKPLFV